jgi:hypothetical protein
MKRIPIKTTNEKFFRQFLEILRSVPPISKLRPKELDVFAELLYQFKKYKDYPESHQIDVIFGQSTRKEMREKIGIGVDSFNNNVSILRRHKLLTDGNRLHPFFHNIVFDNKFELTFVFTE